MKKLLSLALAALTVATLLAGCAPAADQLDPAITLASSDAATYAEWLDTRLDTIPDDVVLGIGSNESYGVDMTNFDTDGYIARAIDGEVLLFGATADGLDRAVREYAKAADAQSTAALDTVYHEGARIKKLTIDGTDISDFTVVYRYDGGTPTLQTNGPSRETATLAANELVRLIAKATGVTLTSVPHTETVEGPAIVIDYMTLEGVHTAQSYSYEVKDGNLYINGIAETAGCLNGVYGFLEYELGWDELVYGDSQLQEADWIDVPDGTAHSVDPMFDYLYLYYMYTNNFTNERGYSYLGIDLHSCHGMLHYGFEETYLANICYSNADNFEYYYTGFLERVSSRVNSGSKIGENYFFQDIAHPDDNNYCLCRECKNVYRLEGNTHSGAVVRFGNKVAERMEEDGYGGLNWGVFAYWGTNKPCKTAPRHDVYVTLCTDGACVNHPIDGSDCFGNSTVMYQDHPVADPTNNKDHAAWIKGWGELTDNLYLWHYGFFINTYNYTMFDSIYADWTFFSQQNVLGVFYEAEYEGTGLGRLRFQLISWLNWHPDATEEEYELARNEIMEREYGEGWEFVLGFIDHWRETEISVGCFSVWDFYDYYVMSRCDVVKYAELSDTMYDLLEEAKKLTSSFAQEKNIALLQMEVALRQCYYTYFVAYETDDAELMAHLEQRYQAFVDLAALSGININAYPMFVADNRPMYDDLHTAAWNDWLHLRSGILEENGIEEVKPIPQEYLETEATSASEG